jgi:FtsP/CotA-like multicopper oxidase with cupredoxin domain
MNRVGLTLLISSLITIASSAETVSRSLHILRDSLTAVDGVEMPYITFNETQSYTQNNPVIELMTGDTLNLWVYNLDTIGHDFIIDGVSAISFISPGDSIFIQTVFPDMGAYIYHDPLDYPANTYLGLGGMIVVRNHSQPCFYWNMKEHDAEWNNTLASGGQVLWADHAPDYFTINGNSNPNINTDASARVVGSVGDTLHIFMANTGLSIHSIHFHGYHAAIEYSSKYPSHVGREKDTFPVYPMESLVLRFIPHQPGEYPVHDHNLVAVTGNQVYPNGMFTTMLIAP